jgi:Rap1a immunity proteins
MRCKEPNGEKWGYCTGFADGIAHFLNEHEICLPGTATSKQIREVAVKFLQEHPELRSKVSTRLLLTVVWRSRAGCRLGEFLAFRVANAEALGGGVVDPPGRCECSR